MKKANNPAIIAVALGAIGLVIVAAGRKSRTRGAPQDSPVAPPSACPDLQSESGSFAGFDFHQYMTGGAKLTDDVPVIYYFHGLAADPAKIGWVFEDLPFRARVIAPKGPQKWGSGPAWWTRRSTTSDQRALADEIEGVRRNMATFISSIESCLGRRERSIITGHSQGGMMTLAVASYAPDLVRAAVAAAGWLPELLWPLQMPPTYVIHGTEDETVSFDRSLALYNDMVSRGLPIETIYVEGGGHKVSDIHPVWEQTLTRII